MMGTGLLWYDNGAQDLAAKVGRAVQRYRERFGQDPNVCYVHPATLPEGERQVAGLLVRPSARILLHHLWVGVETKLTGEAMV